LKKILVFGVSGLTGYKIANLASKDYQVFGTYNKRKPDIQNISSIQINLTDRNHLNKIFNEIKPNFVINTTALHNVDYCEENPDESFLVNSKIPQYLFENSENHKAKFVHISTDYVFDGKKTLPYNEKDDAIPISVYGESKLDGEKILKNTRHVVLRPSVVYGWTPMELAGTISSSGKPMNFAMWLLSKLHTGEPLKIVTDQFATATLADSLAESALNFATNNLSGLYHLSGLSCESRFDFSRKFAKEFGYDENLISAVDSSQFKQKAKRPKYSCLDCSKAKGLGLNLLDTDNALKIMKSQVEREASYLIGKNQ